MARVLRLVQQGFALLVASATLLPPLSNMTLMGAGATKWTGPLFSWRVAGLRLAWPCVVRSAEPSLVMFGPENSESRNATKDSLKPLLFALALQGAAEAPTPPRPS